MADRRHRDGATRAADEPTSDAVAAHPVQPVSEGPAHRTLRPTADPHAAAGLHDPVAVPPPRAAPAGRRCLHQLAARPPRETGARRGRNLPPDEPVDRPVSVSPAGRLLPPSGAV